MRLYVPSDDQPAQKFATQWLKGRLTSCKQPTLRRYDLVGGGERPILLQSTDDLGKRTHSCKIELIDGNLHDYLSLKINPNSFVHQDTKAILGQLKSSSKIWIAPKHIQGRGGAVVYEELIGSGRVIRHLDDVPANLPPNGYFNRATGIDQAPVVYGTSDASNVFELLLAIKAGCLFDKPVVFDQYEGAHTVGDYLSRVLQPSLAMLGKNLQADELGLSDTDKFTQLLDADHILTAYQKADLTIGSLAAQAAQGATFALWYRRAMQLLADQVMQLLEVSTPVTIIAMESLFNQLPEWNRPLRHFAHHLQSLTKRSVRLLNLTDSAAIKTDDLDIPLDTLAKLHQRGQWLAGYPIYELGYQLGQGGGLIQLIKDGDKGEVHRLALPNLYDPDNGLHVLPVGLFRLHAQGQDANASIDPWIMLELLQRWGAQAPHFLRHIWDLMEVPLDRQNIGRATRVALSLNGLEVNITNHGADQ